MLEPPCAFREIILFFEFLRHSDTIMRIISCPSSPRSLEVKTAPRQIRGVLTCFILKPFLVIISVDLDTVKRPPETQVSSLIFCECARKYVHCRRGVENIVLFYHVLCSVHFPAIFVHRYQFSVSHKIV
jgi:hypothetical protein